jgi:AcrR family transcriptional regulator
MSRDTLTPSPMALKGQSGRIPRCNEDRADTICSNVPEPALFTVKPSPTARAVRRKGVSRARKAATHGVGRPRDERIDAEVTFAVLSALKEGGYRAVTIDGIAQRVGRARTSIYRRWASKRSLVAYAVLSEMGDDPAADTGSVRGDLEAAVSTLLNAFAGPLGRALAGLVADMAQDKGLALTIRKQVLTARRRSMREALIRGRNRGEVRDSLDVELVLDMLTAPFYYRALFGHAPITLRTTRQVVAYVLRIIDVEGP